MTRWNLVLVTLALAGAGVVVLGGRTAERDRPRPPAAADAAADPLPETVPLRILAKRHLAREAGAGRRSLAEAAALFGDLNRLTPELPPPGYSRLDGASEEEQLCRQVIAHAGVPGPGWPPDLAEAAVARLEAELGAELCRHGTVRLPGPAGLPSAEELLEEARGRLTDAERRAWLPAPRAGPP